MAFKRINKRTPKPTLGLVGKVKIGELKTSSSGKSYPSSLGHFRFTSDNQQYIQRLEAQYNKASSIEISFLNNDPAHCVSNFYEFRDHQGKLYAEGDGDSFTIVMNNGRRVQKKHLTQEDIIEKYGSSISFMEKVEQHLNNEAKKAGKRFTCKAKEILKLRFAILGCGIMGEWELRTSGEASTIPNVLGVLDLTLEANGGVLTGVVFDLSVKRVKSDKSGDSSQYSVISLTPKASNLVKSVPSDALPQSNILLLNSGNNEH